MIRIVVNWRPDKGQITYEYRCKDLGGARILAMSLVEDKLVGDVMLYDGWRREKYKYTGVDPGRRR